MNWLQRIANADFSVALLGWSFDGIITVSISGQRYAYRVNPDWVQSCANKFSKLLRYNKGRAVSYLRSVGEIIK